MQTIQISPVPADRFDRLVPEASMARFNAVLDMGADRFATSQTSSPAKHGRSFGPTWTRPTPRCSVAGAIWEGLGPEGVEVIPPCIDAFAPKNQRLDGSTVRAMLRVAGLVDDGREDGTASFIRRNGTEGIVSRTAELDGEPLEPAARIVLQVSRWDPLKDPVGLLRAFVDHVPSDPSIRLVLAGPEADATADDPEAEDTLAEVRAVRDGLPIRDRHRVLLASLPMDDADENAAIMNALQRQAAVVVQKSLAEGFGLTVAEAMGKERPVVASRVGGIQDQIIDGVSGALVDPMDPAAVGGAISDLLADRERAADIGGRAHARVCDEFLPPRYLTRMLDLIERVAGRPLRAG